MPRFISRRGTQRKNKMENAQKINADILAGCKFTTPGETEKARREEFYCSNLDCPSCSECSLVNYGRDCHNNELDPTSGDDDSRQLYMTRRKAMAK